MGIVIQRIIIFGLYYISMVDQEIGDHLSGFFYIKINSCSPSRNINSFLFYVFWKILVSNKTFSFPRPFSSLETLLLHHTLQKKLKITVGNLLLKIMKKIK